MKNPKTLGDFLFNPEYLYEALMDAYPADNEETDEQTK